MRFEAHRLGTQPIIHADMDERMGRNINGPSLIKTPAWLPSPLGPYLLYFADHQGTYLRLAFANAPEGPWTIHTPGCLDLSSSLFPTQLLPEGSRPDWVEDESQWYYPHIASPDVHVDEEAREIRMYFHGMLTSGEQMTRVALSRDGLNFQVRPELLGSPYFRVFPHDGWWYAFALPNQLLRSRTGLAPFEVGPTPLNPSTRHTAALVRGETLHVFWSEIGDTPERIYAGQIDLSDDWQAWELVAKHEILRAKLDWEGGNEPIAASVPGAVDHPVNQLRDPGIFEDGDKTYLLYSACGEAAIGIAELKLTL
ncbi:MAG: hypothetical protein HKN05_15005 [Rhizobiales bacterium]|nr:hypothetical protein [Hyphomicrobiales bacterium]